MNSEDVTGNVSIRNSVGFLFDFYGIINIYRRKRTIIFLAFQSFRIRHVVCISGICSVVLWKVIIYRPY